MHTGIAYTDADSHLSVHPIYGPWLALRALVVLEDAPFIGVLSSVLIMICSDFVDQHNLLRRCAAAAAANYHPRRPGEGETGCRMGAAEIR